MSMSKNEILLAAALLEMAAERFSNNVCNDLPTDFLNSVELTNEEMEKLDWQLDHHWMRQVAKMLREEAKEKGDKPK